MKKRFLCLLLSLLMLWPLAACQKAEAPLTVCADGQTEYRIVYPEGDAAAQEAAGALCGAIRLLCGVSLEIVSDYETEQEHELLVGKTNRAASDAAMQDLKGLHNTFVITAKGKQVALAATDGLLRHAAELFLTSVPSLLGGNVETGALSLPTHLHYVQSVRQSDEKASVIAGSTKPALRVTGTLAVQDADAYDRLGAICTDGERVFSVLRDSEGRTRIRAVHTQNASEGGLSPVLELGFVSSMCYNSLTGLFAVCHDGVNVSLLDPNSFRVLHTYTLPRPISAIAYLPATNRYLAKDRDENSCLWLDGVFRQDGAALALPAVLGSMTVADMAVGGRYVHFLIPQGSSGTSRANIFTVDLHSTRYLTTALPIDLTEQNAASLSMYDSTLYVGIEDPEASGSVVKTEFYRTEPEVDPSPLFTKAFCALGVSSVGITASKCFNTYTVAGSPSGNTVMQGGCTDGEYAYICMENQAGNYSNTYLHDTRIVKVRLSDNTLAAVSQPLPLHHSNDMCYNSKTGLLVVALNGKQANTVSFVDPDSLQIVGQQVLPYSIYSIAYEPISDRYAVGLSSGANGSSGRDYAILDGNFNVLAPFIYVGPYTHYSETKPTTQGIDCDSRYIYSVLGVNNSGWTNWLVVHDWNGNFICAKLLPDVTVESENLFHVGSDFYVGFNGGSDPVYRFRIQMMQDEQEG